ncbi:receptor activity-modifying protein 2-like [Fukomys damarensis]|uniref:receptor activity-modifying protein 2-like n=1 Tax=Fukomys damarensis TaxID=885580 RepID=UPI00054006EC|nr:receptor activity-modifying protein 2-like [Fukomys damarensis]
MSLPILLGPLGGGHTQLSWGQGTPRGAPVHQAGPGLEHTAGASLHSRVALALALLGVFGSSPGQASGLTLGRDAWTWLSPCLARPAPPPTLLPLLSTAAPHPQETLAQPLPSAHTLKPEGERMDSYEANAQLCWAAYKEFMGFLEKDWCNWTVVSRPYSSLRDCLEIEAEAFSLGFPNPLAERIIFETHHLHFANCSRVQPTFSDPPEDVLLAMIVAPICLIPFLVTLVVWRSKDGEAKA